MNEPDFLEELIEETTELYPEFPEMLAAVGRRRDLVQELSDKRRAAKLSQTAVGASMGTSQSAVARLETTDFSPNLSTLEKYAYALGYRIEFVVTPIPETPDRVEADEPRVRAS